MYDLFIVELKEIKKITKYYQIKWVRFYNKSVKHCEFKVYSWTIVFLRDIQEGTLSIKDADKNQFKISSKLNNVKKV